VTETQTRVVDST